MDRKRKPKWIPLGMPVRGNKRKAEAELNRLIGEYEQQAEEVMNDPELIDNDLNDMFANMVKDKYDNYLNDIDKAIDSYIAISYIDWNEYEKLFGSVEFLLVESIMQSCILT